MKRHGKPSAGILGVKQSFFSENASCCRTAARHAALYTAQPRRRRCKLCEEDLPAAPDFTKQQVPYASCRRCGHLNGLHEDTTAFCEAVYLQGGYEDYYASADAEAYRYRTEAVYAPKAAFLADALRQSGEALEALSVLDFGAGAGYFLKALADRGVSRAAGVELSPEMTAYANRQLGEARVRRIGLPDTLQAARACQADVVSMIGVLEHLQDPRGVLRALRDETKVRYLFLCLPLFSLCVFLEMAFPASYPRHLVSDHTHLFTPRSIGHMEAEFGLVRRAEWWFGSDMIDLYRHVLVTLSGQEATASMAPAWTALMQPLIDPLQLELDRRELASEVHLVLELRRPA